jgi:hypothetical protein
VVSTDGSMQDVSVQVAPTQLITVEGPAQQVLVQAMKMKGPMQEPLWELPWEMLVQEERGAVFILDVPTRVETAAADASLGTNDIYADGRNPDQAMQSRVMLQPLCPRGGAWTWWCAALVLACVGAQPWAMQY